MKRKNRDRQRRATLDEMIGKTSKQFADNGKLIESGWTVLRHLALPPDAPEIQIKEMRKAFMAGAQHLFASIMTVMDPEAEPTEQDLKRLDLIDDELAAFAKEMVREYSQLPKSQPKLKQTLGDAPVEDAYRDAMVRIVHSIDEVFNGSAKGADRKTAFVLLAFPFGEAETGRCNFMSNGVDRRDIVVLFKEMIARFEGQPEMKGHA